MNTPASHFDFAGKSLDLSISHVMGILNITPDSFSDGGELLSDAGKVNFSDVMKRAEAMVRAGAAILDVGGESTRPGAKGISSEEEINRVMPVMERLRESFDVVLSADTSNPDVISLCRDAGVGLINDVRALSREGALEAAAQSGLPVCLMHMQGTPENMQADPVYDDVVNDISNYLEARVNACIKSGIGKEKILLDPGFGFGKTLEHNLELLSRLGELQRLELPLLIGISRKRMIGLITGRREKDRLSGGLGAAVVGVMNGARIVRTHDVAETVDALKVCNEVLKLS